MATHFRADGDPDPLEQLADVAERLEEAVTAALGPQLELAAARDFAKAEFYEAYGYWPTDQQLDRSDITVQPLPPWFGPLI